jgi:hypothetical protein
MMEEYQNLLNRIEKTYTKFIKLAKKINPENNSAEMKSIKSEAMLKNIELRGLLNKFRDSK